MARTQQEESRKKFVLPVVTPKAIDLSTINIKDGSIYDLHLDYRLKVLEHLITQHASPDELQAAKDFATGVKSTPVEKSAEDVKADTMKQIADLKAKQQALEASLNTKPNPTENPQGLAGQTK